MSTSSEPTMSSDIPQWSSASGRRRRRSAEMGGSTTDEDSVGEEDHQTQAIVESHYRLMRLNQTVRFVERMEKKYCKFDHAKMTIVEALNLVDKFIDASDPDIDVSSIDHLLQTAEGIRKAGHPDWFQLVGLIHDLGKIQYLWGCEEDGQGQTNQWALGGDSWVVGCQLPDSNVFPQFNRLCPDMIDERYMTPTGMYERHCGMKNVRLTWGHDEYLYRVLVHNNVAIPEEGLAMVRFHSCYPWHRDHHYEELMVEEDYEIREWVKEFNRFDLYTKSDTPPDIKKVWPYYLSLIDMYVPGKLEW